MRELRFESTAPVYASGVAVSGLMRSIFSWMFGGLILTGFVSMYVVNTPEIASRVMTPVILWGAIIAELALVVWLSARVQKMSPGKATTLFLIYSALNGITLAPLAFVYTGESIATSFMVAASMFGAMAVYGYVTKKDLSAWGSFLMMGLVGIIVAAVVNIFVASSMMSFVISVVGVIVFTGLTAYDVQKFKSLSAGVQEGTDDYRRLAIIGALSLYLDFINLFIMLVRLLGNRD